MAYEINTDYLVLMSGTTNRYSREFKEAVEETEKKTPKGSQKMKNLVTDIESISGRVKDSRISSSKGNITNFSGYQNIKTAMDFIKKSLPGAPNVNDLTTILNALTSNQSLYSEGYSRNVRLVILEYENATYMLVTGLATIMSTNMDVVETGNSLKVTKKNGQTHGVISKTIRDLAKQLGSKNHKDYLEGLLKGSEMKGVNTETIKENVTFLESTVGDTVELVDTIIYNLGALTRFAKRTFVGIKQSVFGIVPLIRSVLYLRYKKKADTINALEQQCAFIQQNIEQLENIKTMDPEKKATVIKKQKAVIENYRKKAEKLRAQLCETEKEAATEISKVDPKISKDSDDDFVLEMAGIRPEVFKESEEGESSDPQDDVPWVKQQPKDEGEPAPETTPEESTSDGDNGEGDAPPAEDSESGQEDGRSSFLRGNE